MNSNENTPQDIIHQLNDYLEESEQSRWLADVFCVWDQEEHAWLPGTPVLIRTEMRDVLLAWPDGAHLQISTEAVDTFDIVERGCLPLLYAEEERAGSDAAAQDDGMQVAGALCWRRRPCMSHFIGSAINRFVFVPSPAGDELFVYFIGGESMRIAATRIVSHMLLSAA